MNDAARLKSYLAMHLNFLLRSAEAFDAGETDEAMRIAVTIRVLLHNTRSSTSLLQHLNAADVQLVSSCGPISSAVSFSNGFMFYFRTAMTDQGPQTLVKACLDDGPPIPRIALRSHEWWNQIVFVLSHGSDRRISRKDIVLVAANKDGGAHVDQNLTPQYESLKNLGGTRTRVHFTSGDKERVFEFENVHQVLIRQMAHELIHSPELIALSK